METTWKNQKEEFRSFLLQQPSRSTTTQKRKKTITSGVISQVKYVAKLMDEDEPSFYSLNNAEIETFYKKFKEVIKGEEKYFYSYQLALRKYLKFCGIQIDPVRGSTQRKKNPDKMPVTQKNLTSIEGVSEGCTELSVRAFQSKSGAIYLKIG